MDGLPLRWASPSRRPTFRRTWSWYHDEFLGAGSYRSNTWRPTSAVLRVEALGTPRCAACPRPSPPRPNESVPLEKDLRRNPAIQVLLAIDPSSFPVARGRSRTRSGTKGDYPVVWTNRGYRMAYVNMGHDDLGEGGHVLSSTFSSAAQNQLIRQLLFWLAGHGPR